LSAGAFSSDDVVKASEKVTRIMVFAGKHDAINKKFGVRSYPTVLFLQPDGSKIGTANQDSSGLVKQVDEIVQKHGRAPKWVNSETEAADEAKKDGKPLLVFYRDDAAKSDNALKEFGTLPLSELYGKAVWLVKRIDPKSEDAKTLGITAVPVLWVVDPRIEDSKGAVVKKIALPKAGAALKGELSAIVKGWKKDEAPKEEPKEEKKEDEGK